MDPRTVPTMTAAELAKKDAEELAKKQADAAKKAAEKDALEQANIEKMRKEDEAAHDIIHHTVGSGRASCGSDISANISGPRLCWCCDGDACSAATGGSGRDSSAGAAAAE